MPRRTPNTLTIREEEFVACYLEHLCAKTAAIEAFRCTPENAARVGFKTLRRPLVRQRIREELDWRAKTARASKYRTMARIAGLAFTGMSSFLEAAPDGSLRPRDANLLSREEIDAIASVDVLRTTTRSGIGEGEEVEEKVIRVKLNDPTPHLKALMQYHGLAFEKIELEAIRKELAEANELRRFSTPETGGES